MMVDLSGGPGHDGVGVTGPPRPARPRTVTVDQADALHILDWLDVACAQGVYLIDPTGEDREAALIGRLRQFTETGSGARCDSRFYGPRGPRARCIRAPHTDDDHWNGSQGWSSESAETSRERYAPDAPRPVT